MTYSQVMTSYLGSGTHAARPATPNVASGVAPIYYETDTTHWFGWTGSAWVQIDSAGGGGSLTTAHAELSADLTPTTLTWTDVLSLSLAAGTWLVDGRVLWLIGGAAHFVSARLYDATNAAEIDNDQGTQNAAWHISNKVSALYVGTGTVTLKLQAYSTGGSDVVTKLGTQPVTTVVGTRMLAVKVA